MEAVQKQLKVLVLLLVLIFGITVFEHSEPVFSFLESRNLTAAVFNPVSSFLGLQSSQEPVVEYESLTQDPEEGNTFNILGETPTAELQQASITESVPILLCLPNDVREGEEAIIMWACQDGANTTTGEGFDTGGETSGTVRVSPSIDTQYRVDCINDMPGISNTAASCFINVVEPTIALLATPSSVISGETTSISWRAFGVKSCMLTSDTFLDYSRSGTQGDIASPTLTQDTTFKLTCETSLGETEERELEVIII